MKTQDTINRREKVSARMQLIEAGYFSYGASASIVGHHTYKNMRNGHTVYGVTYKECLSKIVTN